MSQTLKGAVPPVLRADLRPFISVAVSAVLWLAAYNLVLPLAQWLAYSALRLEPGTHLGEAVAFFLYDVPKILLLLSGMIFLITVVRTFFSPERTRALLSLGMLTWPAYVSAYGAIQAGLADDWEHALEGWEPETRTVVEWRSSATAGEWHSIDDLLAMSEAERGAVAAFLSVHPDCKRARPMSRREAWQAGRGALVRIPIQEMPMLLMPEDSRRAHVGR